MSLFNVSAAGVITVDSSGIRESFVSAYKNALGSDLNTDAGTPQGQMILNDTAMLTYAQNQAVLVANAYNVLTATGSALDVVANFWGYYRKQEVATVVACTFTGSDGTVIPIGSLVSDGTNNYATLDEITISGGSATGQVQCVEPGAVVCASGAIDEIVTVISGWDTVSNTAAGVTGYDRETDNQFRARITANWFNVRARGALGAIWDNMAALPNVASVCVRENPSNENMTIDTFTLVPHSVFVCVAGGSNDDIARCMYNQKTIGANTNGNTNVVYYDETSGLRMTYKIQRAEAINIGVAIQYQTNYFTTADVVEQIKTALMEYVKLNPFGIGQIISGNMLAQAFHDFVYASFLSIKVGVASSTTRTDYLDTTIGQIAVLDAKNIVCTEVTDG